MYDEEKIFTLSTEIKYHHKGTEQETDKIYLRAPSYKNRMDRLFFKECINKIGTDYELQQSIEMSLKKAKSNNKDVLDEVKDEGKDSGDLWLNMFMASNKVNTEEVVLKFEKMLCNGCAYIEDLEPLRKSHYENIPLEDQDKLLGKYLDLFFT